MDRGLIVVIGGVDDVDNHLQAAGGGEVAWGRAGGQEVHDRDCLWVEGRRHQTLLLLHRLCTWSSSGACGQRIRENSR